MDGESVKRQVQEEVHESETRWLYCVECPQYGIRLEALGYLCRCRTVA